MTVSASRGWMGKLKTYVVACIALTASAVCTPSQALVNSEGIDQARTVWDLGDLPEDSLDIGLWSLVIAKECYSSIDIPWCISELDRMVAEIRRMLAGRITDMDIFLATRMFQYDPGPWNGQRPFAYDLEDPMGMEIENRLLSTYLRTRKGNCVSMPTLFLVLMDRVDPSIPFQCVMAPLHLFCRMHDRQSGEEFNVECTSGGYSARDEWYVETMDIPQAGIDSGVFLRALNRKEFLAELICILISKHRRAGDYEAALRYADLALELNPRSVTALVQKGALIAWMGQTALEAALTSKSSISESEKAELRLYSVQSQEYIERARALGWRPETESQRDDYLRAISEARKE